MQLSLMVPSTGNNHIALYIFCEFKWALADQITELKFKYMGDEEGRITACYIFLSTHIMD